VKLRTRAIRVGIDRLRHGISDGLIRLSVAPEDSDDLQVEIP
jgi:hypothetical protein